MKKICLIFVGLTPSNGVARVAINIANLLTEKKLADVTLIPLYRFDKRMLSIINPNVHIKKGLGFYFRGLDKIIECFPMRILHKFFVRDYFDIEIGFQYGLSSKIVAYGGKNILKQKKYLWMHGYDEGVILKNAYTKVDKVICVSKFNSLRLKSECPNINVDFCYNPINEKYIRELGAKDISILKHNIQLVTVGRLSPEKGYERLIYIVDRLKKDNYSFNLWIIGDGQIKEKLVNLVDNLELNDYITFLGTQQNPHMYTSKADLFICSSYIEGYSTACTEAIMLGVPVITTNCSGGEEIIEKAQCGILTTMEDNDLYYAIKKVLQNPQLIVEWKNVLSKTSDFFSQEMRIGKLINILNL